MTNTPLDLYPEKITSDSIIAGSMHTCLITPRKRMLRCWGNNNHGQVDIPQEFDHSTHAVSAGYDSTCGINRYGQIKCFGWNSHGQCDPLEPYETT
mmetsp:Transcript_3624/g.3151  ORF Transcript_3624/g.3151 Transcript_3624/m.3151 type:complete len:96 (+) Transcript_3624:335-622(+)